MNDAPTTSVISDILQVPTVLVLLVLVGVVLLSAFKDVVYLSLKVALVALVLGYLANTEHAEILRRLRDSAMAAWSQVGHAASQIDARASFRAQNVFGWLFAWAT